MNKKISGSNSLNFVSVSNFTAHAPHRDFLEFLTNRALIWNLFGRNPTDGCWVMST